MVSEAQRSSERHSKSVLVADELNAFVVCHGPLGFSRVKSSQNLRLLIIVFFSVFSFFFFLFFSFFFFLFFSLFFPTN